MTRKKAISNAIELLKDNSENEEIVLKLQEILCEMPLFQWTEKSIIDVLEEHIEENGYLPSTTALVNKNGLPSNTVIENKFNVTSIVDFYKKNFPEHYIKKVYSSPYKYWDEKTFIKIFKENYERIRRELHVRKVHARVYNRNRDKKTPLSVTIVENCGCKSYEELLIKCGYSKPMSPISAQLCTTYSNDENSNNELRDMLSDIQRELDNSKKIGTD